MYVLLIVVCPFVLFLLAIVLSALLRNTDSDYTFCIFKLFSQSQSQRQLELQNQMKGINLDDVLGDFDKYHI
jgi:hypothetical protein